MFTSLAVSLLMAAIATGWSYNGEQDKISRCPCPRGSTLQVTRAANDQSELRIREKATTRVGGFTFKRLLRQYTLCQCESALALVGAFSVIVKTDGSCSSTSRTSQERCVQVPAARDGVRGGHLLRLLHLDDGVHGERRGHAYPGEQQQRLVAHLMELLQAQKLKLDPSKIAGPLETAFQDIVGQSFLLGVGYAVFCSFENCSK